MQLPNEHAEARYLRRDDAAAHIRSRWGMPCSRQWLAKLAVIGGGPAYQKAGRFPVYQINVLDDWARARLSEPRTSSSAA